MRRKDKSVSTVRLQREMLPALIAVDLVYRKYDRNPVITAGDEMWDEMWKGIDLLHSVGSLHPFGLALDFRIFYFSQDVLAKVVKELKDVLRPQGFDVFLESDHIHIEYDPK